LESSYLKKTKKKLRSLKLKVNQNAEALKKNFLELTELKHILRKTQQFFEEQDQMDVGGGQLGQHQQLLPEESSGLQGGSLQVSILSLFYNQLLRTQIPKV